MVEESHREGGEQRLAWLDRDTLLDVLVNAVPIVILAFFSVLYTVVRPWEFDLPMFLLMHFLTLFPLALLVVLTYVSARAISRDEEQG